MVPKIRKDNTFKHNWAIRWNGDPEDFSDATDINLTAIVIGQYKKLERGTHYRIDGNIIKIDCTPSICNRMGVYKLELKYKKPNSDFIDGQRRSAVDLNAFEIVPDSAQANVTQDISTTSDAIVGFNGKNSFQVWKETHEGDISNYEAWLRQPAMDAAREVTEAVGQFLTEKSTEISDVLSPIQEAETARVNAEGDATNGRVKAENERVAAEEARVNAEGDATKGRVKAENDRVKAEQAREAAEEGRAAELAIKANHGYDEDETPKSVKELDTEIGQLAGDVRQRIAGIPTSVFTVSGRLLVSTKKTDSSSAYRSAKVDALEGYEVVANVSMPSTAAYAISFFDSANTFLAGVVGNGLSVVSEYKGIAPAGTSYAYVSAEYALLPSSRLAVYRPKSVIYAIDDQARVFDAKQYDQNIDIHSAVNNYNFSNDVLTSKNIGADGIMETLAGRGVFFFRLYEMGIADSIEGVTPLAYSWYSSMPDYVSGSNSLGRTTTNTPPATAQYCGITFSTSGGFTSITIKRNRPTVAQIAAYGSALNNSAGEGAFANGVRTNIKILGFGNSFMRNSVHHLSALANGAGVNLIVGNLYTGGTNLNDHLNALKNATTPYVWNRYENGINTETITGQTAKFGLERERWDAIILHQYTPWVQPFEPYLNQLIELIIKTLGYCPKIYLNATWAGSLDNNVTYYGYATELEMWQAVVNYNIQAGIDSGILGIIPTGTAIQNARTLAISADPNYNRFVNNQGDEHHLNQAGGFIAAATIYEKIVYPLNKIHCSATTLRLPTQGAMPPSTIVMAALVTEDNYVQFCNAAIKAVESPNVVTTII